MRYLRMLSNSVIGGFIVAAYLLVLVLQLNPELSLQPTALAPLGATLVLSYGLHAAVLFYLLIVLRQLLAAQMLSPGWLSLRLLVWLSTGAAAAAATLMWMNLRGFRAVLDPETARRMATGAVWMSACALLFLAIGLAHYSFGRRGSRVGATLYALALVASVSLPLAARGRGASAMLGSRRLEVDASDQAATASPRVAMILLDGASLDFISPAAAEGRLPNFGKLLDTGAVMHLATLRPTQPAPVWIAVATGKLPFKNGVRSEARYAPPTGADPVQLLPDFCFAHALVRFGFLEKELYASSALRARPIWNILSNLGISTGIVGWPLTHPAQPLRGYLVSDQARVLDESRVGVNQDRQVYPPEAALLVQAAAARALRAESETAAVATATAAPERGVVGGRDAERGGGAPANLVSGVQGAALNNARGPLTIDAATEVVAAELQLAVGAQVTAVRYQSLDAAGHVFLRYAVPRAFGDVSEEERRQYGRVLEQYYSFIDGVIGRAIASMAPDDLLLIVSGFGMEPLGVGKRLLDRALGNAVLSGSHEGAPDGFMLAYGSAVAPGKLTRASVVDVTPTVLYFLGLPVGRDMDGFARTDVFSRRFTAERPITFIPTYDR